MFHVILNMQSIGQYPSRKEAAKHLAPHSYIVAPCVYEVMQLSADVSRAYCPF